MKKQQSAAGALRGTLDSESQLLFDEVTTKYLRDSWRGRPAQIAAIERWVDQKYAEDRFRAFVNGLGADKQAPIRDVLADPQFRLRAWQQVRQWDHDRDSGAWALREKEVHDRYRPRVASVRVLYVVAAVLMVMGLVIDEGGPVWAGLVVVVLAFCVQHFALPPGGQNYPVWRAHTDRLVNGDRPDTAGR